MNTTILERNSMTHKGIWQETQQTVSQVNSKKEKCGRSGFRTAAEVAGHILAALAGLAVFKFTGLYDAMTSVTGQIILGSLIAYWYMIMFRHGLYSK
jgi:hypothetical protein